MAPVAGSIACVFAPTPANAMKGQTVLVLAIVAALATAGTARLATEADAAIRETAAEVTLLEHKVEALEAKIAKAKITPELEPVSDKKFFDGKRADYSTDERARRPDDFRYPFPVIQADREYDTDYVKDDNTDDGYYAAQMEYDTDYVKDDNTDDGYYA